MRAGAELVNGAVYLRDGKGSLVPIEVVKPQHLVEDDLVRDLYAKAKKVSDAIAEFKALAFEEIETFNALLDAEYGGRGGGKKGNLSLMTYDGTTRIQVQISDQTEFGAELQTAKGLVDECLQDWSSESRPELRALVDHAFQVDKTGEINRGRLFGLLRLEIADERWVRAMKAIRDSIRVTGSKQYIRLHRRRAINQAFEQLSLDAATA